VNGVMPPTFSMRGPASVAELRGLFAKVLALMKLSLFSDIE
jgi:hypothetical protein